MADHGLKNYLDKWAPVVKEEGSLFKKVRTTITLLVLFIVIALVLTLKVLTGTLALVLDIVFIAACVGFLIERICRKNALKKSRDALSEEIKSTIEQEDFSAGDVVEGLFNRVEQSLYRDFLLKSIDSPTALILLNRDKIMASLQGFSKGLEGNMDVFSKIDEISDMQNIAVQYAQVGRFAESIALLITAQVLYRTFALGAPQVKWQEGNTIYTAEAPWKAYSFRHEIEKAMDAVSKRKVTKQLVEQMKEIAGMQEQLSNLLNVEQGVELQVADQALIDRCGGIVSTYMLYLAGSPDMDNFIVMSYMPGEPTLLKTLASQFFKNVAFVPNLIEVCIRRSEEMTPELVRMFKEGESNACFNASIALGIIQSEEAKQYAAEVAASLSDPLKHLGALFILARMGESDIKQAVLPYLDNSDETVAHAAAIVLEHLKLPVPNDVLEKQLKDGQQLVKLRLTRHIKEQSGVSPTIRDLIWSQVLTADEDLNKESNAVVPLLYDGDELLNLAKAELDKPGYKPAVRKNLQLVLARSHTSAAAVYLLEAWNALKPRSASEQDVNHMLSCLGETGSMKVVPTLIKATDNDNWRYSAFNALLQIAGKHPQELHAAAKDIKNKLIRTFLCAILGGSQAEIDEFVHEVDGNYADLGFALQLSAIIAHPALKESLRDLLTTDRGNRVMKYNYRYLTTKALFAVIMKGA